MGENDTHASAIDVLAERATACDTAAAIAAMLGVNGKTVRDVVRRGALLARERDANGKRQSAKLPPVYVSREGRTALTDAHKRAIVFTFLDEERANAIVAAAT